MQLPELAPAALPYIRTHVQFRTLALMHFLFLPLASPALTEGNYTYTVTDGKATIIDFNSSYSGVLSIPATLGGGYPVTSIGSGAFTGCTTSFTSVTIPASVTLPSDTPPFLYITQRHQHPRQRNRHQRLDLLLVLFTHIRNHPRQRHRHRRLGLGPLQIPLTPSPSPTKSPPSALAFGWCTSLISVTIPASRPSATPPS